MFTLEQVKEFSETKTKQLDELMTKYKPGLPRCLEIHDDISDLYINLIESCKTDKLCYTLEMYGTIDLQMRLVCLMNSSLCLQDDTEVLIQLKELTEYIDYLLRLTDLTK